VWCGVVSEFLFSLRLRLMLIDSSFLIYEEEKRREIEVKNPTPKKKGTQPQLRVGSDDGFVIVIVIRMGKVSYIPSGFERA